MLLPAAIDDDGGAPTRLGEPKKLKHGFGLEATLTTRNSEGLSVDEVKASVDAGKVYGSLALWLRQHRARSQRHQQTDRAVGVPSEARRLRHPRPAALHGDRRSRDQPGPRARCARARHTFRAIEANGSASYSHPWDIKAAADLKLLGQTVASGLLEANFAEPSGSIVGDMSLTVLGNGFQGRLEGWLHGGDFQVSGQTSIELLGHGLAGGEAFLSTRGMGGCRRGIGPDFGWRLDFSESLPGAMHVMVSSCDFGDLRCGAAPRQAGVAAQRFVVGRNTSGLLVRVRGVGGQPAIVLRGGGREFVLPAAQGLVETPQLVAIRDAANNDLYLVLNAPTPGPWTIDALSGSAPLQGLGTARALEAPRLCTTLRRLRGGRLVLTYRTRHSPGQRVQFVERAAGGLARVLRRTASSKGRIVFKPKAGSPGIRTIQGTVDLHGSIRESKTVGTFRVRSTIRPAKPRRLVLLRRGPNVVVNWLGVRGQAGYVVGVRLRDGRRFEQTVGGGRRGVLLRDVNRSTQVSVTVRSFTRSGIHSQSARRILRSGRRR